MEREIPPHKLLDLCGGYISLSIVEGLFRLKSSFVFEKTDSLVSAHKRKNKGKTIRIEHLYNVFKQSNKTTKGLSL